MPTIKATSLLSKPEKLDLWGNTYTFTTRVDFECIGWPVGYGELFNQEPYHCEIHDWLLANCKDGFMNYRVCDHWVLFTDPEEALLCRMAFSA